MRRTLQACFLLCLAAFFLFPACAEDEMVLTQAFFAGKETVSGWIDVPGKGSMRYYAQNDGLWEKLIYENKATASNRPFGDSGCCPTAAAMAIRALVPEEDLIKIGALARTPYAFCPCSLSKAKCGRNHARYILTNARDYERFLPLVLGEFASGNNIENVVGRTAARGTASGFVYHAAEAWGLAVEATSDYDTAFAALSDPNKAVMAHASRGAAFTNTGHYVVLASADEQYVYVLDPLSRTEYKTKYASKLNIRQPGLVAVAHEDMRYTGIGSFLIFSKVE